MPQFQVHSRCASPRRLSMELSQLVGPSQFTVEMRQSTYSIHSSIDFSLDELVRNCQRPLQSVSRLMPIEDEDTSPTRRIHQG
ncbi:hypothetical protein Micbo1qcDRAFT_166920 [Microdochium bolleyi]|uniref:Uncharacterized protein n=1 Tax=Microdochium bolleyi TaxID=196109 RepID=A0A136ITS8_9PEZI|nr:hypothetical protein Micbo1qcDRAFT_166920 [Microdochium bolleyi]